MARNRLFGRPTPAEAIATAAEAVRHLDPSAQKEAMDAVSKAAIEGPDQPTANDLWRYLVVGLLGVLGVAVVGLIVLLALSKDNVDLIVTAFSSTLTGLLGLFAPSPLRDGAKDKSLSAGGRD